MTLRSRLGWRRAVAVVAIALAAPMLAATPAAAGWIREEIPVADPSSLAFDPRTPGLVLAGTTSGQLYRSTDGGRSWSMPAGDLPFPGHVVAEIVVDPAIPRRFYAALWRLWGSGGAVVRSDDGGTSWHRSPGLPDAQIRAVAVAPGAPYVIVAGGEEGVWQSTDTGQSWTRLTPDVPEWRRVESLAIDPRTPLRIYAGTWRRAYRTDDGGHTWTTVWTGMVEDSDVFALRIPREHPDTVWAATCGWVYRTDDRGTSWRRFQEGFLDRRTHDIDRGGDGRLWAGTCGGLHRSVDDGASWEPVGFPCETIAAVAHDPADPRRILVAVEGDGLHLSEDGGESWQRSSAGLAGAFVLAVAPLGEGGLRARVRTGQSESVWERPHLGPWRRTDLSDLEATALPCSDSGDGLAAPGAAPIRGLPIRGVCRGGNGQRLVLTASCGLYRAIATVGDDDDDDPQPPEARAPALTRDRDRSAGEGRRPAGSPAPRANPG